MLGIDVYATRFPTTRGYEIYENQSFRVLLIRLEDLRSCAPAAFRDFMGIDGFTLHDANLGDEKAYAPLYRAFKESLTLPASYLSQMYESGYARHFYTEDERDSFRRRWERRT